MNKIKKITEHHIVNRFLFVLLFTVIFMTIGSLVPETYYKYLDKTEYLTIRYPMSTDKQVYAPCEDITLISSYVARYDIQTSSYNDWTLVQEDGTFKKVFSRVQQDNFLKSKSTPFSIQLEIPCTLHSGTYFISGIKKYTLFGNERQTTFVSDTFIVKD